MCALFTPAASCFFSSNTSYFEAIGFSSGSVQPRSRVEMLRGSVGFRRKLIKLRSRKHTLQHIFPVSSSSCVCLLYGALGLSRECAHICDKEMSAVNTESGFQH